MKKLLVLLLFSVSVLSLQACQRLDYTPDEAFEMMNEAIQHYRDADQVELFYVGSFTSLGYNSNDAIDVKLRKIGADGFLGRVEMSVTENNTTYQAMHYYQAGMRYLERTDSNGTTKTKKEEPASSYISLFTSFLKKPVEKAKIRALQILVDRQTITVSFELGSSAVEDTLYVSNTFQTVQFATVKVIFSHQKVLQKLEVSYGANAQGNEGIETYEVLFKRINRYVPIVELTNAEKNLFTLQTEEENA